jgi:hypothetical protein
MVYEGEQADEGDAGQRLQIGGEDDCGHDSLQRVGADGSYNIYFRCNDCEAGIVKLNRSDTAAPTRDRDPSDEGRNPPNGTVRSHPLVDGLTPDDSRPNRGHRSEKGVLDRLGASLRDLLGNDREE